MPISPHKLMAAVVAAQKAVAELPEDDQRLKRDTIEGETALFELLDRCAEQAVADKLMAEKARDRAKRFEARADSHRDIIARVLDALELSEPLVRPTYTASLAHTRDVIITDAAALPEALIRHAPDVRLIGKLLREGREVEGATLGNAQPSLTLRTA